jgi:AAHS family 4-hydroxybenzoate transporter-like MFS transporter
VLLALRLIQGIAVGGLLPLAWALNIEYVPKRYRATVVTLIMLGWVFGSSAAGPMTVWLTPRYGWRSLFVVGGCMALAATVLLIMWLPESIRFLASQKKRPDLIARYARRLAPGRSITASDRFVIPDEMRGPAGGFSVSMLFRNELRWITPLIWTAYTVSSVAVFFGSSWGPSILQMIGYNRSTASLTASVNILGGAIGGLLLMRFIDTRGAISIVAFPILAVPILLAMGLTGLGGYGFLVLYFFATMFLVGAHMGLLSITGMFYPSSYRSNGAGWAASVGKIGSIAGPALGGIILSSRLPVKSVFALLCVCPFIVAFAVAGIGRIQGRMRHAGDAHEWPSQVEQAPAER